MTWTLAAFISAGFAALVAIFGKLGVQGIDSTLATTVRAIIMATFLFIVSLSLGKFKGFELTSFTGREWLFITLAGIAGALSWLFYFVALKNGPATAVSAIDRTSIIFVVLLAALLLGEAFGWKQALGAIFIALGAYLVTMK
jgi:bacterial/archaeal transporter family protein